MYEVNGPFGEVRTSPLPPAQESLPGLFCAGSLGWHRCNDQYRIVRSRGCDLYLLLYTVRGTGCLELNSVPYSLPAGSVALVPRNIACKYYTPRDNIWEFYWVHPAGAPSQAFWDTISPRARIVVPASDISAYADRMEGIMDLLQKRPVSFRTKLSQSLSDLFHRSALDLIQNHPNNRQNLSDQIISWMEKHYQEQVSVEDLAASLYLSASHLIREFRRATGVTPYAYLTDTRLRHGEQLLRYTDLSMEEIASRTGFCSASHFVSTFRRSRGMTPAVFRKMTPEDDCIL